MDALKNATEEQQRRILEHATPEQMLKLDAHFEHWAHKNQLAPPGEGWTTWLMMAGRGFGKTRAGAEWIFRLGEARPGSLIALAGATIGDARTIMVEGVSGLINVARRYRRRLRWEPSLGRLSWPNGSKAQLFSGDNPDGLRGPEHDYAWGLAGDRCARRAGRRWAAGVGSAGIPQPRRLPSRWTRFRTRMVGEGELPCHIFGRRLEVHRSVRGPRRPRPNHRIIRGVSVRRLANRHHPRIHA